MKKSGVRRGVLVYKGPDPAGKMEIPGTSSSFGTGLLTSVSCRTSGGPYLEYVMHGEVEVGLAGPYSTMCLSLRRWTVGRPPPRSAD